MSIYSQFGASPFNPVTVQHFTTSQTFVPKFTGWATFVVVGSGGGGKGAWLSYRQYNYGTQVSNNGAGTSGAAGGVAIKTIYVQAGSSYVITVGAGGAGMQHYPGYNTNGRAGSGSVSSVVGPGISLVVTGGQGGGSSGSVALSAVGGTIANATNCTYDWYAAGGAGLDGGGGGAVGIFGSGVVATSTYGAGTGGGDTINGANPANGFPNATGRNFGRAFVGGLSFSSSSCTTVNLPDSVSGVLSNCGGGGFPVGATAYDNNNATATGGQGGNFAGGGVGSAYQQMQNRNYNGYPLAFGGKGGKGAGGASAYAHQATNSYFNPSDPGTQYADGRGGAGGDGFVMVEFLR